MAGLHIPLKQAVVYLFLYRNVFHQAIEALFAQSRKSKIACRNDLFGGEACILEVQRQSGTQHDNPGVRDFSGTQNSVIVADRLRYGSLVSSVIAK